MSFRIRKDIDNTYEIETEKGIFNFNSWSYDDDKTLIELFEDGHKATELRGNEAINLYEYLTPDSSYE